MLQPFLLPRRPHHQTHTTQHDHRTAEIPNIRFNTIYTVPPQNAHHNKNTTISSINAAKVRILQRRDNAIQAQQHETCDSISKAAASFNPLPDKITAADLSQTLPK